ncbi:MAG: hypothetical protein R3F34_06110 [Planctomycetota bacterium]
MKMSPLAALTALALTTFTFADPVEAQTSPVPWPLGCPVPATVANDGTTVLGFTPCQPFVTDPNGTPLYIPFCTQVFILLAPGDVYTSYWNQNDGMGLQVPPGVYLVNGVPYDLGAANCALRPLGAPYVGATRHVELCAPGHGGEVYVLVASASTTTGIALGCGQVFPLDYDALMFQSLYNPAIFGNFVGTLDANGRTNAPAISVPAQPFLSGFTFQLGYITLDAQAPCGVGALCAPVATTVI